MRLAETDLLIVWQTPGLPSLSVVSNLFTDAQIACGLFHSVEEIEVSDGERYDSALLGYAGKNESICLEMGKVELASQLVEHTKLAFVPGGFIVLRESKQQLTGSNPGSNIWQSLFVNSMTSEHLWDRIVESLCKLTGGVIVG